jgi:hypothetical protein
MSLEAPIAHPISQSHRAASDEFDRWRGRCVRHFARLEQAIVKTLSRRVPGQSVPGHGLGGRLKLLAEWLDGRTDKVPALTRRLAEMIDLHDHRAALVHGDGPIYVDARGNWLWDCSHFVSNEGEPTRIAWRQADAEQVEKALRRTVHSLTDHLRRLEAASSPPA